MLSSLHRSVKFTRSTHNLRQCASRLRTQPRLYISTNTSIVSLVRILEVRPDPSFHIRDLWKMIFGHLSTRVQLCKSNSETEIIDVLIGNDVFIRGCHWWVNEKFEQSFTSECPSLLVTVDKRLRIRERLREGHHGRLAVEWPRKLLSIREDDGDVHLSENTRRGYQRVLALVIVRHLTQIVRDPTS